MFFFLWVCALCMRKAQVVQMLRSKLARDCVISFRLEALLKLYVVEMCKWEGGENNHHRKERTFMFNLSRQLHALAVLQEETGADNFTTSSPIDKETFATTTTGSIHTMSAFGEFVLRPDLAGTCDQPAARPSVSPPQLWRQLSSHRLPPPGGPATERSVTSDTVRASIQDFFFSCQA